MHRTSLSALALSACALMLAACAPHVNDTPALSDQVTDGKAIADAQCSRCHATGATGDSPRPDAPVFRHVLSRYGATPLADAFIEGLKVGHPDMPVFKMTPVGVDSLIAYLKSIQTPTEDAATRK